MTVFLHELKRSKISLIVWTSALSFMLAVCIFIYPEMSSQMSEINEMFANMGNFTAAFGMDQLNFGEFMGYFGAECGNVLGMGGAFFAALAGIAALAKEEKDRTAEFLLTHPISRRRIVTEKLLSVALQITLLNAVVLIVTLLSTVAIGENPDLGKMLLSFLSYYLMQLEVGAVTFGISAFIKSGSLGIGLGFAFGSYALNIVSNLMEELEFLKFITPFGYTDSSYVITEGSLEFKYLLSGVVITALAIYLAFYKYEKKDIS